jgi:hypothetical protein
MSSSRRRAINIHHSFLPWFRLGRNRQVEERDAVLRCRGLQRDVIRHDGGDVHREFADPVAVQQVLEAMIIVRHHDQHAGAIAGIVNLPLHVLGRGDCLELLPQFREIHRLALDGAERYPDEEALRNRVVELLHLDDVEAATRQERRHGSGRAHATDTSGGQNVRVLDVERHGSVSGYGRRTADGECRFRTARRLSECDAGMQAGFAAKSTASPCSPRAVVESMDLAKK